MLDWRLFKRSIRFWWQRRTRGWDDSETWNLDTSFEEWILPRLKRYRELYCGYPSYTTEQEWQLIVDKMILAFQLRKDLRDDWSIELERDPDIQQAIAEGLDLFREHYFALWW